MVGINLPYDQVNRVAEVMGCPVESFLMKYFGLPLGGDPSDGFFRASVLKRLDKSWKKIGRVEESHNFYHGRFT